MARTGRPTNNPTTLARKQWIANLTAKAATYAPLTLAKRMPSMLSASPDVFASATASAMLGNGRRGLVRRAMIDAQNGECFTCGALLDGHAYTMAVLFRLVPSIIGADEEVAGVDAMNAGTLPGNLVAACITCNADRNRASAAMGEPVAVTASSMTATRGGMLNASSILYVWPAGAGARGIVPAHVATAAPVGAANFTNRRAARMAALGW